MIGILLALTIPAAVAVRESSRKAGCASNLRQLGIAIGAYESAHRMFPPGGAFGSSWLVHLLPMLDQQELFNRYDFVKRDADNVRFTLLPVMICPSDPTAPRQPPGGATSYAGNFGTGVSRYGYNGLFRYLSPESGGPIRAADVRDGLSATASVAEILHSDQTYARLRVNWDTPRRYGPELYDEFCKACSALPEFPRDYGWRGDIIFRGVPWTEGNVNSTMYNHMLPPNQPSCIDHGDVQAGIYSAASVHAGGVNLLFADGRVTFISNSTDLSVWREMGSRVASDLGP